MNRPLLLSLALTSSLLTVGDASADTRSWTAVKKVIGKGDTTVVSIDLAAIRNTSLFKAGWQMFEANAGEAKGVFDGIKAGCGVDVTTAVTDFTLVMQGDDRPLLAFGLDGVDEAKVASCMGVVVGQMLNMPGLTFAATRKGKLTEYAVKGEKEKVYVAWLAKDVLVFTEDVNDAKQLTRRLSGKGATGDLAKLIGKTTASAPLWFAVAQKEKENGRTILGGYGKLELAAGTIKAAGAILMSKATEATAMATEGNQKLGEARTEMAGKSAELARILSSVKIGASGAEVTISGAVSDKDAATLVPQLDTLF